MASITSLIDSWMRHLEAAHRSDRTLETYREAIEQFARFVGSVPVTKITTEHVVAFQLDLRSRGRSDSTVNNRYRSLNGFFKWLADEGEIDHSPMQRMKPPTVETVPLKPFTEDELKRLLAACKGNNFAERRDTAILRVLMSTGVRVSELATMKVAQVDLNGHEAIVHPKRVGTKPAKERRIPLAPKVALALDRYVRARGKLPQAVEPWLWISNKGRLTENGMRQMLHRRGEQAGVDDVHPHRFRAHFAMDMLEHHEEGDVMDIGGWKSRAMLDHYARSNRQDRALRAHKRYATGEDL